MSSACFSRSVSAACLLAAVSLACTASVAFAAATPDASSALRITQPVDETKLVRLAGHTHPLARPESEQGLVPESLPLEHVQLQLRRGDAEEKALEQRMAELGDPHSANYHKWLSPEELGTQFGPAAKEIEAVVAWLEAHGLTVNSISKTGLTIDFSGSAGRVSEALHTQIHQYAVNGQTHMANSVVPSIPAALASVVAGVVSLHDFFPKAQVKRPGKSFTYNSNGSNYNESPADFATIYNVNPLYAAAKPITGAGQTIAVLERSDINPDDVKTFRTSFGLASYKGTFSETHPGKKCKDPGKSPDEGEAALDAEWTGAVAPDATILLASCADTQFDFGPTIAAQALLDAKANVSVMSLSYGNCEAYEGPAFNAFIKGLWQQAAAQGVSVYVSAGDSGSAGCDSPNDPYAVAGLAVNGLASTPYNLAAGGTDFLDTAEGDNASYWSNTNGPTGKSAKSYVPEMTWNDSCASSVLYSFFGQDGYRGGANFCNTALGGFFLDTAGGSGGASFVYAKPKWQLTTVGMPNNGRRNLPDVSLFASDGFWSHAILYCMSDTAEGGAPCNYTNVKDINTNSAGGTSFVAPQLAGVQALINQHAGGRQGNPAPVFYSLHKSEFGTDQKQNTPALQTCNAAAGNAVGSSCVFHDVTVGNNDVPCYGTNNCVYIPGGDYGVLSTSTTLYREAYNARSGWDFTSGLGSVNVTNLVNAWP